MPVIRAANDANLIQNELRELTIYLSYNIINFYVPFRSFFCVND